MQGVSYEVELSQVKARDISQERERKMKATKSSKRVTTYEPQKGRDIDRLEDS